MTGTVEVKRSTTFLAVDKVCLFAQVKGNRRKRKESEEQLNLAQGKRSFVKTARFQIRLEIYTKFLTKQGSLPNYGNCI